MAEIWRQPRADFRSSVPSAVRNWILGFSGFSILLSGVSIVRSTSVGWLWYFLVSLLIPVLVGDLTLEARALRRAIPIVGSIFGAYSTIEFAIERDPIYDSLYFNVGRGDYQHWSSYRADSVFSHPLFAGTFFAIATVVALTAWLEGGRRREIPFAIFCGTGLVLTLSRGAFIATTLALFAVFVGIFLVPKTAARQRMVGAVAGSVIGVLIVSQLGFVQNRLNSAEAASSTTGRGSLLEVSIRAVAQYYWMGSGPGTSRVAAEPFNDVGIPIESGYLELLISLGIVGFLCFIGIAVSVVLSALSRGDLVGLGMSVAFFVSIAGYNSLDGHRSTAILFGLVLIAASSSVQRSVNRVTVIRHPCGDVAGKASRFIVRCPIDRRSAPSTSAKSY
ncbi:O-antigen ligase [Rhodococcus wratislaviensis]|uniref:O-antigen ligase family protein n=1 Tax=Rhodococcus wratislaviensis TaxID=44752 RepID=UPI001CEC2785|nr:O-antigen ligase family protein [Rhodococcus wratislaviensis]